MKKMENRVEYDIIWQNVEYVKVEKDKDEEIRLKSMGNKTDKVW